MRILRKQALLDTPRHVRDPAYETIRFLLAADGVGVTVTDIVLAPGIEAIYGDPERTEIAYCIEGAATLTELPTSVAHPIAPGTMWIALPGERFRFHATSPTRLICVFLPAYEGHETGFAPPS